MAKDPVCGMQINEAQAAGKSEYQDRLYFFCSLTCKQQLDRHPEHYVSQQGAEN